MCKSFWYRLHDTWKTGKSQPLRNLRCTDGILDNMISLCLKCWNKKKKKKKIKPHIKENYFRINTISSFIHSTSYTVVCIPFFFKQNFGIFLRSLKFDGSLMTKLSFSCKMKKTTTVFAVRVVVRTRLYVCLCMWVMVKHMCVCHNFTAWVWERTNDYGQNTDALCALCACMCERMLLYTENERVNEESVIKEKRELLSFVNYYHYTHLPYRAQSIHHTQIKCGFDRNTMCDAASSSWLPVTFSISGKELSFFAN